MRWRERAVRWGDEETVRLGEQRGSRSPNQALGFWTRSLREVESLAVADGKNRFDRSDESYVSYIKRGAVGWIGHCGTK